MDEKACKYKEIYEYWNYDTDDENLLRDQGEV